MRLLGAALASLLLVGCQAPRSYVSEDLDLACARGPLRTLISFRARPGEGEAVQRLVERSFLQELEATGRFVPIAASRYDDLVHEAWQPHGPPAWLLERLSQEGVEALAMVSLRNYEPFPSQELALSVEIHSTRGEDVLLYRAAGRRRQSTLPSTRSLVRDVCCAVLTEAYE